MMRCSGLLSSRPSLKEGLRFCGNRSAVVGKVQEQMLPSMQQVREVLFPSKEYYNSRVKTMSEIKSDVVELMSVIDTIRKMDEMSDFMDASFDKEPAVPKHRVDSLDESYKLCASLAKSMDADISRMKLLQVAQKAFSIVMTGLLVSVIALPIIILLEQSKYSSKESASDSTPLPMLLQE